MKQLLPLIEQRADPFIYKHTDGYYYFTASVPSYEGIELRRSGRIEGLRLAEAEMVWTKPDTGPLSDLIWAPEIHFNHGCWYVYFAAAPSREIKDDLFQHRMYAISNPSVNPLEGTWSDPVQIETGIDTFCLDATTFKYKGELYYLWAQKHPSIRGNSNLYIAKMDTPTTLATEPVLLSKPELEWEIRGFWVNEGPSVLQRKGKVFVSYSASATDENYAMGLLYAEAGSDLLDPNSWTKLDHPVLQTDFDRKHYGPGHNSFTVSESENSDLVVYHARTYTEIEGDPLWDPNRHTYVRKLGWSESGMPVFNLM